MPEPQGLNTAFTRQNLSAIMNLKIESTNIIDC